MARWSEVSDSSRGAVFVGSDGVVLMPRGETPQRRQKEYEQQVGFARSLERGVAFSGDFGLGFLPWDGLHGPVSLARWELEPTEDGEQPSFWMETLVARGDRVIAVDEERQARTLDAANMCRRSEKPLPRAVLDIELAGERAVLAAFVTASESIDGQESPVDEFYCFWSDDGHLWQETTCRATSTAATRGAGRSWAMATCGRSTSGTHSSSRRRMARAGAGRRCRPARRPAWPHRSRRRQAAWARHAAGEAPDPPCAPAGRDVAVAGPAR